MFGLTGQPTFIENECLLLIYFCGGWDKLYVSLLSTETGKTVSKSGKASGSARSSILGEATINLAGYMSSRASIPVSLPLKKCNHGTILQVITKETPNLLSRNTPIDEFPAALQGFYWRSPENNLLIIFWSSGAGLLIF
ncbi:hypothetical protein CsSME_00010511 [Camellia sinensis var. sinensis]